MKKEKKARFETNFFHFIIGLDQFDQPREINLRNPEAWQINLTEKPQEKANLVNFWPLFM